ncbi:MAG: mechanosensitive ion channel family protein [Bacteroidales bacterium]|nr:mechanosensitive ion channel family protein [Bacteroidales bacterium]
MKKHKRLFLLIALLALAVPAAAVFTGMNLDNTLSNLRRELHQDYTQISQTREQMLEKYDIQHRRMVDIVKKCNDQSLMLYSQKQEYTFDISYALEKVSKEYRDFNKNRTPYDRIVSKLDIEINRYARLIESLRRLPPELKDVEVVPDSLAYHNDTLDTHLLQNESLLEQELQEQVDVILAVTEQVQDTSATESGAPAFILSEQGQTDRDTCLFYASELLKMYAGAREVVMADSTYYKEAQLRMTESYDYARDYYNILQKSVFKEGQIPWMQILMHPEVHWQQIKTDINNKYSFGFIRKIFKGDLSTSEEVDSASKDSRFSNSATLMWLGIYIIEFFILWGLLLLILWPVFHFVKPLREKVAKEQRRYLALLLCCVLFIALTFEVTPDDRIGKALGLLHAFLLLLTAITAALLFRLEPQKLKSGFRNYLPTICTALFVISCRCLFIPNAIMNLIFPPLLLLMTLWQFITNLFRSRKADRADAIIGWVSFGITAAAMLISWAGFIFLALIILVWWYFQLALILGIATVWDLLLIYKESRLDKRLTEYKERITYVSGSAKEQLLFGASWFYDLVREVIIPSLAMVSIPLCLYWALDIFEFNDLFRQIFQEPFLRQGGPDGFRVSLYGLLFLSAMFCLFRYMNKAIHTIWQSFEYRRFLRKYKRTTVRNNEINLSLGNSLISVFIWFVYLDLVIVTLNIPTGSLGLIAGGLSAGIGLALKDIINNFIYGIQLMGGRLRVGDWIECDGVRGKVTDINYQTTLVETLNGTQVAFLNSSLFGKSFTNLTRNNSYEMTIVKVGVAYGTDFEKLRKALEKGLEAMKTKDAYGRDVVEPTYGIYIRFDDFGDSSVNVAVRQKVLVPEQIEYVYRCKELIYKILKENGITIPFPQRDVHMIADDK